MLQLNGFTHGSLTEIQEEVKYTHTEEKNEYFSVKYLLAHAQTQEREKERERDGKTDRKKERFSYETHNCIMHYGHSVWPASKDEG